MLTTGYQDDDQQMFALTKDNCAYQKCAKNTRDTDIMK